MNGDPSWDEGPEPHDFILGDVAPSECKVCGGSETDTVTHPQGPIFDPLTAQF